MAFPVSCVGGVGRVADIVSVSGVGGAVGPCGLLGLRVPPLDAHEIAAAAADSHHEDEVHEAMASAPERQLL